MLKCMVSPSTIPINLRSNLIEDACQSLGAKVKNIPVGLQGIAGVFFLLCN